MHMGGMAGTQEGSSYPLNAGDDLSRWSWGDEDSQHDEVFLVRNGKVYLLKLSQYTGIGGNHFYIGLVSYNINKQGIPLPSLHSNHGPHVKVDTFIRIYSNTTTPYEEDREEYERCKANVLTCINMLVL
jgi:hypothetical protein